MSGINSLSGLNKVNVDFRPTVSLDEQNKGEANEASSKAVARIVEGEKGEKAPLAGRNITVANGDHASPSRWRDGIIYVTFRNVACKQSRTFSNHLIKV